MKQEISQSNYIYKIHQLIHLAEINFLVCQKIYKDYLSLKGRHKNIFLVLIANNAFEQSLSVLQTLICSTEKNDLKIESALEKVIENDKNSVVCVDPKMEAEFVESIERDYPYLGEETFYGYKKFLLKDDEPDNYLGGVMADIKRKKRVENGLKDFQELQNKFKKYSFHKIRHHQVGHKHQNLKEPAGSADLLFQDVYIDNLGDVIKDLKIKSYYWFDFPFGNPNYSMLDSLDEILKKI